MDITELILTDHHEQRRLFATLDDLHDQGPEAIAPVWERLRILLEVHAEAEERLFYPELLRVGEGEGDKDSAADETEDAIGDHNDIRAGIASAADHELGSPDWWDAVATTRKANSEHMGEEEREALADFRRRASLTTRHELGLAFATFEGGHADGVESHDEDPERYVARQS